MVRRLEDVPGLFDDLVTVERRSEFDADLKFSDAASAEGLAEALSDDVVPSAMREAIRETSVVDDVVRIRFEEVPEVQLTARDGGREAACVRSDFRGGASPVT